MKLKAYKKHLIIFLVLSIFTHKSFALKSSPKVAVNSL